MTENASDIQVVLGASRFNDGVVFLWILGTEPLMLNTPTRKFDALDAAHHNATMPHGLGFVFEGSALAIGREDDDTITFRSFYELVNAWVRGQDLENGDKLNQDNSLRGKRLRSVTQRFKSSLYWNHFVFYDN